jgi:hypothetical protein
MAEPDSDEAAVGWPVGFGAEAGRLSNSAATAATPAKSVPMPANAGPSSVRVLRVLLGSDGFDGTRCLR